MIRRKILLSALVTFVALNLLGLAASRSASAAKFSVSLTFTFGKRQPNGKCGPGRGICEIKLGLGAATALSVGGVASPINDQKLDCVFQGKLPDGSATFSVDRDIQVDDAIAQKLGFKSLTIRRGEYGVNAGKGSFGGVELNVSTTK
ncbi:MAG: hypothetical protein HYR56_05885 [Acidobacteria bacterium]|nr:hypothetical protein [Acidobacteriota bacterium]MBI3424710.1 hypothetical protein [Acidobacteriota bacterium]